MGATIERRCTILLARTSARRAEKESERGSRGGREGIGEEELKGNLDLGALAGRLTWFDVFRGRSERRQRWACLTIDELPKGSKNSEVMVEGKKQSQKQT